MVGEHRIYYYGEAHRSNQLLAQHKHTSGCSILLFSTLSVGGGPSLAQEALCVNQFDGSAKVLIA